MLLMLSGCVIGTPTVKADSACISFGPITPTERDWQTMSRHLNEQITKHDAAWDRRCSDNPVR